ncbi:MAG: response regulator [Phycisphaerae bacterium]
MAKKILAVDDDPDYLAQLRIELEAAGYEVLAAESSAAAEEILRQQKPDLAICDLMMEHTDRGFTLCHHIKKLDPKIPVLLVTAVASETGMDFDAATSEERSWVKADAVLAKPVRFEQLRREIGRLLKD